MINILLFVNEMTNITWILLMSGPMNIYWARVILWYNHGDEDRSSKLHFRLPLFVVARPAKFYVGALQICT